MGTSKVVPQGVRPVTWKVFQCSCQCTWVGAKALNISIRNVFKVSTDRESRRPADSAAGKSFVESVVDPLASFNVH